MCHRIIPLDRDEVIGIAEEIARDLAAHEGELASLDPLESFRSHLAKPEPASAPGNAPREAYPQSVAPLIVPTGHGAQLAVADMRWGFEAPWKQGVLFNTRFEGALDGTAGMWRESLARRRCLVPVRTFFESHAHETEPSARTGKPVKRQYAFERADGAPLLLAAVHERGRFSVVTTEPNADVAPVHNRMPLVLDAREAPAWLAGDFAPLLDRGAINLVATPERPDAPPAPLHLESS